ncbi:MAG: Glu/Leu/Phe/Val dehydrogenase dimerization domain-containing protein [Planctomycetota bacterium]
MTSSDVLAASECEQVLIVRDRDCGVTAVVAVHDTRLGPAHGGIRRLAYPSLAAALTDVVALAEAMTWKCALAEVPAGGGKAVILDRPGLDRHAAYRLVGRTVAQLGGRYFTGPDVGTTDEDLRVVAQETRFVAGGDGEGPGPGDLTAATATGVAAAIEALAARLELPMKGMHIVVQGLGAIGMQLCAQLHAAGVRLTVADVVPARTAAAATAFGAAVVPPEKVVQTPCDVFAPCALGGVIDAAVAARLPVRGVCGAANNIFTDAEAARVLHERSVRVVPDFVANAGALILGASWRLEGVRVGNERLTRIAVTAGELLDRAAVENVPPTVLALQLARERLARGAAST